MQAMVTEIADDYSTAIVKICLNDCDQTNAVREEYGECVLAAPSETPICGQLGNHTLLGAGCFGPTGLRVCDELCNDYYTPGKTVACDHKCISQYRCSELSGWKSAGNASGTAGTPCVAPADETLRTFDEATLFCSDQGGRVCTLDEVQAPHIHRRAERAVDKVLVVVLSHSAPRG